MANPRAVLFDLDGTLVDSAADLHACVAQLLTELKLQPIGLAEVTSFIGEGIAPLVQRSLAAAGLIAEGQALEAAVARYNAIYAAAPARHSRLYDGVATALADLAQRGLPLGVCTNKAEALARAVLDTLYIGRSFALLVGGDTLSTRKPDPQPLLHCAERLGATPATAIYVGDSEIDAAAARAAGMPFVLFTRGYRKAPVERLPHAARFDDFSALADVIGRI